MILDPWPFQRKVIHRVQADLRKYPRLCIVMPTGSGKTLVSGHISLRVARELAGRQGGIALYLVHRKELIRQTVGTLKYLGLGDQVGVIAAGQPGTPWAPLQIASIPTITRRLDKVTKWLNPKVIFVDEAHHVAAATWERVIRAFPNAFLIGMTATPVRLDGKGLGNYFDHLVLGPQISDLIPEYLAPVETFSIKPEYDLRNLRTQKALGEAQTGPIIANLVSAWERYCRDRRSLFFCVNIDHSKRTVARLVKRGVKAVHIDYKTSNRERILDRYEAGDIQVLSNVELFTEGTDAPATACIVHGRPTNSFALYRQMNGRGFRRKQDGGNLIVLDCAGNFMHGGPAADVDWELEFGVGEEQKKALKSSVRVCDACNYVYSVKEDRCPLCGVRPLTREVQEFDLELQKVDSYSGSNGSAPPKPNKRELSRLIEETGGDAKKLHALARRFGYKAGWAKRMADLYGFAWPRK